jgi:hypothetical protein
VCGKFVTAVTLDKEMLDRVGAIVEFNAHQQETGQLGTRKQDSRNNDRDIDQDGTEAELVACTLLCPDRVQEWFDTRGPNRAMDLLAEWMGLPKAAEIKQTKYPGGHLLIRPPKRVGHEMREEYVDDCIYILVTGPVGRTYTLRGWTDREHFLKHVNKLPVGPVPYDKCECWGIRASNLLPMESLFSQMSYKEPSI